MNKQILRSRRMSEGWREWFQVRGSWRSEMGRSSIVIVCPFCSGETRAFVWSLAGCGKRCTCGAKHLWIGYSIPPKGDNRG